MRSEVPARCGSTDYAAKSVAENPLKLDAFV